MEKQYVGRINKKSLQVGVYDHLKNYYDARGVGIITDKQFIFYTQVDIFDGFYHDNVMVELDQTIYPYKKYHGFYESCKDAVLIMDYQSFDIEIPRSGKISQKQKEMLLNILDDLEKFNKEAKEEDKIRAYISLTDITDGLSSSNVEELKKQLDKLIIRDEIEDLEEQIIDTKEHQNIEEQKRSFQI